MREVINFNTKWAFSKEATAVPATMPERWYWVTLPHTWKNAVQSGLTKGRPVLFGI